MVFQTVYEITQEAFTDWIYDAISLALFLILAFTIFIFLKRLGKENIAKYTKIIIFPLFMFLIFGIIWNVFAYKQYINLKNVYLNNEIQIVEGFVTNVHLQYGRINKQNFQVGQEHFEISENIYTGGFDKTVQNGGPIVQGLYVRLYYYTQFDKSKVICRVDIRK